MRIGIGYDVHAFAPNRKLILGGIEVPHYQGLQGHSDADILLHAICDALLGALSLGDIGQHYPDSSEKYKNISSLILLRSVYQKVKDNGYSLENIDSTIILQKPKISTYIPFMREKIAQSLNIELHQISIKATTTEKLGFQGKEEGISAQAVCLLVKQ